MQTKYTDSNDPRYQLDRKIREAACAFSEGKITAAELLAIASNLKGGPHV